MGRGAEEPGGNDSAEFPAPRTLAPPPPVQAPAAPDQVHFRLIADRAPVMIWACDAYGGYTFFNEQWVMFTGQPREALLDSPWLMDIHPDDYPRYRQHFLSAFQERVEFRVEYRMRRSDGRYRWLLDTGVPMFDDAGAVLGYIGSCVDITDRHVMEEALAQSERKFKLLFDLSADAQVLLDGDRVVDCNPATAELLGAPDRWSIIGRGSTEFLGGDATGIAEKLRVGLEKHSHRFEWTAARADGAELPVEVLLTAVPVSGRTLVHAVIRDLTERRALETRLMHSQKMEAIGTLAGGIAHDFNNILAAIMGYTELALMELAPEGHSHTRASLSESLTAARRARDLVQQILTFSRNDAARRRETDLARVVEESARLLRASIPATVEIRVKAERGCVVACDPTQFQQVLLNLGANAEHAMRATGGGALDIALTREELDEAGARQHPGVPPGPVARLVVRDTGAGMPAHVRERAFDPFFTTKPVGEGTGMGLAVVHGIVTSHRGSLTLESAPGQGTTFTIVIPCVRADPTSVIPSTRPVSAAPHGRGHVLVVEDEPALGRMFRRLLGRLGYSTDVYENAREALDAFLVSPARYDVVVTDLTMPGMTGDVLASEVRRARPELPVILVTGYSPLLSAERVREVGISAVLRKPLTVGELAQALRAATGGSEPPQA